MANRNMLDNRINNLVHKINVFLLCLIVSFAPTYVFASMLDPTDRWIIENLTENKDSLGRTTTASINARKVEIVNGTARQVATSIEYRPAAGAAGRVMFKRLAVQVAAGAGVAVIGAAAVDALLKGIGWIMEDGVYVKKVGQYDGYTHPWLKGTVYKTKQEACDAVAALKRRDSNVKDWAVVEISGLTCNIYSASNKLRDLQNLISGQYKEIKKPLTPEILDDIMTGNYTDPDDSNPTHQKNDGQWTGVKETFQDDPNAGEGSKDDGKPDNEVSKDVEQSLENSPNKTVKNTGSETKSKGENTKKNADGTEEKTQTETKTELPAFCNYAASLCKWIDWTQNDDQTDKEDDLDIDKQELDIPAVVDTSKVQFSSQCPAPLTSSYSLFGRSHSVSYSFDSICTVAVNLKPAVVGCASIAACYIMLGMNRARGED